MKKLFAQTAVAFCLSTSSLFAFNALEAINATSDVVAVWQNYDSGTGNGVIYAASKTLLGSWSAPTAISSTSADSTSPVLAMNSVGSTLVGWLQYDSVNGVEAAYVSSFTFGGSWSAPVRLSGTTENVVDFQGLKVSEVLSLVTRGFATWSAYLGSNQVTSTRVASSTFGGSWTATTVSSP